MTAQQPPGFQPPPRRRRGVVYMALGGVFGFLALVGLLSGVNGAAYLMGAGDEIRVTVTESSLDSEEGGHDGIGYYEVDGERVRVRLSYVEEGETVTARLPLIPVPVFGNPVITNSTDAQESLGLFVGVVVVGIPAVLFFRNGLGFYTGRIQPRPVNFTLRRPW